MALTIPSAALPPLESGVTLTELGADNLRALRMVEPVELRRLMLLVGRNGIGKSTLARIFPLLRQSARRRTREPLLWWERDQVDFGSFQESLRRGAEEMTFTFGFTDQDGTRWQTQTVLRATPDGCRVHRAVVRQQGHELSIGFDASGALQSAEGLVGGDRFTAQGEALQRLLPSLRSEPDRLFGLKDPGSPAALLDVTDHIFHGNTDKWRRNSILFGLPWSSPAAIVPSFEEHSLGQYYKDQVRQLATDEENIRLIQHARFCWWALTRLGQAEDLLGEIADGTAYLGPFRAVPERTYRPQGVAVEQLDPRGANLAMFLAALSDDERDHLNLYLQESLDFRVFTALDGGQYSVQIELKGERFNLLDVGFGYSQMLPVAVQLWASGQMLSTSRSQVEHSIIVIEQPELHLHPHQQVLMARALGAIAAADKGPIQVIETHSDHLVGEVGMQIARGQLSTERVGVLCIEPHPESGATVRLATFDEDGVLQNWPAGFLSP